MFSDGIKLQYVIIVWLGISSAAASSQCHLLHFFIESDSSGLNILTHSAFYIQHMFVWISLNPTECQNMLE